MERPWVLGIEFRRRWPEARYCSLSPSVGPSSGRMPPTRPSSAPSSSCPRATESRWPTLRRPVRADPLLALSRDGTQLAYVVARGGVSQLFLHRLDEWEGRLLPGTEGAFHPFFSHDGEWIGFFTRTEFKKISVRGGAPQTLGPATYARGATWGENDTIILAQQSRPLSLEYRPMEEAMSLLHRPTSVMSFGGLTCCRTGRACS